MRSTSSPSLWLVESKTVESVGCGPASCGVGMGEGREPFPQSFQVCGSKRKESREVLPQSSLTVDHDVSKGGRRVSCDIP